MGFSNQFQMISTIQYIFLLSLYLPFPSLNIEFKLQIEPEPNAQQ